MHILSGPDILILLGIGIIVFVTLMLTRAIKALKRK